MLLQSSLWAQSKGTIKILKCTVNDTKEEMYVNCTWKDNLQGRNANTNEDAIRLTLRGRDVATKRNSTKLSKK